MKYMLLMYASEPAPANISPQEYQDVQQTWFALLKEMKEAGVLTACADRRAWCPIRIYSTPYLLKTKPKWTTRSPMNA